MISEITIDHSKRIPSSTQIVRFLKSKIHGNEFEVGEQLPPVREIAKSARVSTNTVRAALSVLEKEGLVESARGRGTFVTRNTSYQSGFPFANDPSEGTVRIAAASIYKDGTDGISDYALRVDSMGGVVKECGRINANLVVLPNSMNDLDGSELWQQLSNSGVQGLVWLRPTGDDWAKIEYIRSKQFPVVVTCRSHFESDIVSVESDYEGAGFAAANHFIDKGTKKVLLFTHIKPEVLEIQRRQLNGSIPFGLEYGMRRVLEAYSGEIYVEVCYITEEMGADERSRVIIENIDRSDGSCGVMFSNPSFFLYFMKHSKDQAAEMLSGRPLVVVSNSDFNGRMAQYVRGLDFSVLCEPFEDISRLAVQKLVNIISGHDAISSTLVKVDLESFWDGSN